MKVSKLEYENAVKKCIHLMSRANDIHFEIAKTALSVCTIVTGMGGRDVYSLSKFAKDTGINVKTLRNWVRQYKEVVSKLPKNEQVNPDRQAIKDVLKRTKSGSDSETIRREYDKAKKERETPEDRALIEATNRVKNASFQVQYQWVLSSMSQDKLRELLTHSFDIYDRLSRHFDE